jgi:hypothetical protein
MLWNANCTLLLLSATTLFRNNNTIPSSFLSRTSAHQFSASSMVAASRPLPEGYILSEKGTFAEYIKPIEKSLNDDRFYRSIRLANDLEVLLIQDPSVDKSAAALDVHVGHLSDPVRTLSNALMHSIVRNGSRGYLF